MHETWVLGSSGDRGILIAGGTGVATLNVEAPAQHPADELTGMARMRHKPLTFYG